MSYISSSPPESWEVEQEQFLNSIVPSLSYNRRLAVLLTIGMVAAIEISNRLSINVFLPDMQGNVGASSDEISWVIILYNVGYLCSIAMASWMSRVIGARRHMLLSIAIYATGAMGCVLSTGSLVQLLASRLIMGFGGGAFLVRVIILTGLLFPGKARAAAATKLYLVLAAFEVPYPTVMGWVTDTFHWNYAFLVDFPFLAIGAFLIWKLVPPGFLYERRKDGQVDLWGALLLIASLACLETATSRGERDLWFQSNWITLALVAAVIFFIAFRWWDYRPQNLSPILHLRMIVRHAALRTYFLVILIVGAFFGAGLYVVPQYLRFVQDYSALQAGGFISMYTLGLGLGLQYALHLLIPRLGPLRTLAGGLLILDAKNRRIVIYDRGTQAFRTFPYTPLAERRNVAKSPGPPVVDRGKKTITLFAAKDRTLITFGASDELLAMPADTWQAGDVVRYYYKDPGQALRLMNVTRTDLSKAAG